VGARRVDQAPAVELGEGVAEGEYAFDQLVAAVADHGRRTPADQGSAPGPRATRSPGTPPPVGTIVDRGGKPRAVEALEDAGLMAHRCAPPSDVAPPATLTATGRPPGSLARNTDTSSST